MRLFGEVSKVAVKHLRRLKENGPKTGAPSGTESNTNAPITEHLSDGKENESSTTTHLPSGSPNDQNTAL